MHFLRSRRQVDYTKLLWLKGLSLCESLEERWFAASISAT